MAYNNRKVMRVAMPSNHSPADAEWIEHALLMLSPAHQLRARVAYSEAYAEAYNSEPIEHKRENIARRTANHRLRCFRDKCMDYYAEELEKSVKQEGFRGF